MGNWNAHSQGSKKSEHSGLHGRGVPNRFRRRRGMISQMSLGLGGAINFHCQKHKYMQ